MATDTKARSVLKSFTYIVSHELIFFGITWLFTGNLLLSAGIVLTGSIMEMVYYYLHERIWARIEVKKKTKK
jgi:uncharacterized membrane protein